MPSFLPLLNEQINHLQTTQLFHRRNYEEQLDMLLQSNLIIVIEGQRRVGKSSIITSYFTKKNINLDKVFYLNKELDNADLIKDNQDLENAFNEFVKEKWEPTYLIVDEIQNITTREHFIRKMYALKKYKIIITWSNAKLLSGELATYLTGRFLTLQVYPLSYKEFLEFKWYSKGEDSFLEYLQLGGMPEIALVESIDIKKNFLKNLLNSIVLKDIVERYNIRDTSLLLKLLSYLADNVGSLVSSVNIANVLQQQLREKVSVKTITNYLRYFEIPYLINEVERYDIKGKRILEYTGKYYFTDIWLRNSFWFVFTNDIGKVLENLVYNKLKQEGYTVYVWWYDTLEIDFVAEKDNEKLYVQVCYLLATPDVVQREFGNLEKIKDNYKKIVVSLDTVFGNTYNGIQHLNLIEWLLQEVNLK